MAILLALIHLAVAPALWQAWGIGFARMFVPTIRVMENIEFDPERVHKQRAVFLNYSDLISGLYSYWYRELYRLPLPASWWILSMAHCDHRVHRASGRVLEVELVGCRMFDAAMERIYRQKPLPAGSITRLRGLTAVVVADQNGQPTRVRFTFDVELEHPSLRFLAWTDGALRHVTLPRPGGVLYIKRLPGPGEMR